MLERDVLLFIHKHRSVPYISLLNEDVASSLETRETVAMLLADKRIRKSGVSLNDGVLSVTTSGVKYLRALEKQFEADCAKKAAANNRKYLKWVVFGVDVGNIISTILNFLNKIR